MKNLIASATLAISFIPFGAWGAEKIKIEEFTYEVDSRQYKGFLASGASKDKKAPGVLVVHEWWGQTEYPKERAKELAQEGFVALALDMFGEGKVATHPKEAKEFAQKAMGNLDQAKKNVEKGLEILKKRDDVDKNKLAAIGYCFGGGVVLQMARLGVDLDLAASFHGSLSEDYKIPKRENHPKVLVFNGADDPMVSKEQIKSVQKTMDQAKVDYTFVNYPDAKHAFTNPEADKLGKKFDLPLEYNEKAATSSWQKLIYELKNL